MDKMLNKAFILLGSNEGNRRDCLLRAAQALANSAGTIAQASSIYESAPWGFCADTQFLNQALLLMTTLQPLSLLAATQAIESELGRVRTAGKGYASRCIDIDILFYNNEVVALPQLEIPHPRLHLRRFALLPMAEIAPAFVHPVVQKNMRELLMECED
jgi:2-amino-4-hydroxy-6-hydroxymethyldihydropteridine diphosphokinase